jgi:hypothetical protein
MNDFRRLNQHSRPVNNNPSANNQQSRNIMIIHSLKTRIHVNNNPNQHLLIINPSIIIIPIRNLLSINHRK